MIERYRPGGSRYRGSEAQSRPLSLIYVIEVDYLIFYATVSLRALTYYSQAC